MESAIQDNRQKSLAGIHLSRSHSNAYTRVHSDSHSVLWRPWLASSEDAQSGCRRNRLPCPYARHSAPRTNMVDGKSQSFQHPVRLFWPKSKSFDYLYSDGEALLRNFPVQATISFYEESDTEDEDDDEEDGDGYSEDCLKSPSCFTCYN